MFDKFSEESVKVIMHAQEEARKLKHGHVGCEHLLLGIFASGAKCIPRDFPSLHDVSINRLRDAVKQIHPKGSKASPKELPFNDDAKTALIKAYEKAMHSIIYPEHLLLGLFNFPDLENSMAMKVFTVLKIEPNELRIPVIYQTQFQESPLVVDSSEMSQQEAMELFRDCAKVVLLAMEEARRLSQNSLGTEMLLLGLLGAESTAAKVLEKFGVTLEFARSAVEKLVGAGSAMVPVELPFTPRARRLLRVSLEEVHRLGHDKLDARHLLLAFTREQDGVAWQVLKEKSVDFVALRESVLALFEESK